MIQECLIACPNSYWETVCPAVTLYGLQSFSLLELVGVITQRSGDKICSTML